MWIVWPVNSLCVWIPWVLTWLCSLSMGAAAARGVFPAVAGEKPLVMGALGGTSETLLMEFLSSARDFSAVCSLAQMRSQS
jgi:hypothetical protein